MQVSDSGRIIVSGLEIIYRDDPWNKCELALVNPRGSTRPKSRGNGFCDPKREKKVKEWAEARGKSQTIYK